MSFVLCVLGARAMAAPLDDDLEPDRESSSSPDADAGPLAWIADPPWRRDAPCACTQDDLARTLATAPPLSEVVAAAQRAAGVADDPTTGWRHRSRLASLIPWITFRAGNSESWRDVSDPTISHGTALGATLAWRLDRLLYDPNEPRFSAHDVARRRERRRIAHLASRAYFAWIETSAQAARDPTAALPLMEAVADLDALTDTWFSHTLAKLAGSR